MSAAEDQELRARLAKAIVAIQESLAEFADPRLRLRVLAAACALYGLTYEADLMLDAATRGISEGSRCARCARRW